MIFLKFKKPLKSFFVLQKNKWKCKHKGSKIQQRDLFEMAVATSNVVSIHSSHFNNQNKYFFPHNFSCVNLQNVKKNEWNWEKWWTWNNRNYKSSRNIQVLYNWKLISFLKKFWVKYLNLTFFRKKVVNKYLNEKKYRCWVYFHSII